MTAMPVEANVVLSADNSQYDQAMSSSAQQTDTFAKSVDSLGGKIDKLTKSAGRKMLGITAGDVALIGGATAAWASYEKQMSRLTAQAAVVSRSRTEETRTLNEYTSSVRNLRKEFGTTTGEAAQLTQTVSKLAGNTYQLSGLTKVFQQMGMATGESSDSLASSVLNLQKLMQTPITVQGTQKYADQLTYLAAKSNTTASALADFSSQLAPMGRAMGMSQTQVTGFANMFVKAGQDGYSAATAFNKVAQDITYAVQTGNPDMAKYANLLGVTVEHFKNMTGAQQVAGFFDRINQLGPKASMVLNQFGFDGIRMSRSIQAAVSASGGAASSLADAQFGLGSDATEKGAKASETIIDTLQKLRQELQMTAEEFATVLGPGINFVLKGIEKVAGAFNDLMSGPLGKFIQVAGMVLIPITAITAAALLMATAITKAAGAFMLFRSSPVLGAMEGLRGGAAIAPEVVAGVRTGGFMAAGGGALGRRGAQIAEGGTWFQRGGYNAGQMIGGGLRSGLGFFRGMPLFGGGGEGPSPASVGLGRALSFGSQAFTSQYDAMRYANPAMRTQFFGRYFPGTGPDVMQAQGAVRQAEEARAQAAGVRYSMQGSQGASREQIDKAEKDYADATKRVIAAKEAEAKVLRTSIAAEEESAAVNRAAAKSNAGVYATMRAEGANVARAFAGAAAGATRFAASATLSAVKTAGGGLMGAMGGPWGMGITAAMMFGPMLYSMLKSGGDKYNVPTLPTSGGAYMQAGGMTQGQFTTGAVPVNSQGQISASVSMSQARGISTADVNYATSKSYTPTAVGQAMKGMTRAQAITYLGAQYGSYKSNPQSLQQLKYDLISGFGQADASYIMGHLESGKDMGNLSNFTNEILNTSSDSESSQNMGFAEAYLDSRTQGAFNAGGESAARRQQFLGLGQLFSALNLSPQQLNTMANGNPALMGQISRNATQSMVALQDKYNLPNFVPVDASTLPAASQASVAAARKKFLATGGNRADFNTLNQIFSSAAFSQTNAQSLPAMLAMAGVKDTSLTGAAAYNALFGQMALGGGAGREGLGARVQALGPTGRMFEGSQAMQAAIGFGAQNVGANVKAVSDLMDKLRDAGKSAPAITKAMGDIQTAIGDPSDPRYILAGMVSGKAQQQLALQMPTMTRAQGFAAQVAQFQAVAQINPVTPDQLQAQQDATTQMAQSMADQVNYFKQLLLMQDQYNIQRQRAEQDYTLQRSYAYHDYNLQRDRAEEAYNRQRNRAEADFARNRNRAWYDFNLQRSRQEEDFNHETEVMAKQMAQSVYDIYQRVQAQRTLSAEGILSNAQDQLARMQTQERDLRKLRAEGLSDTAIQQLGLNDPKNQQQLARLVTEMTPQLIRQFNSAVGTERVKAAREMVTDQSSLDAQERLRSYRLGRERSREDMVRQMKLSKEDFDRQLRQQDKDFHIMLSQQQEDFSTAMQRQETAYNTAMSRAAEDLANQGKEISGSLASILEQASTQLTGHAQKQAQAVLQSFKDLKSSTEPEAVSMMQDLAAIFGFKYQPPKGVNTHYSHPEASPTDVPGRHPGTQIGMAGGGIVPGWSPGRDTRMVPLSGGEAIMRPEWARAMGAGAIDAMNHAAKYGGYADGGLVNPDSRVYMDGQPVSKITKAQLLLAEKLSHTNLTTIQGSWQPYTAYSGSSHMGPGVVDEAPGSFRTQYWLRRVGFAAWARNIPGAATAGSGAHVHAVSLLDPGAASQSQIPAFYAGQDGLGGRDYGPNPPMLHGLRALLSQFSDLAMAGGQAPGGGPAAAAALPRLAQILKHRYPHAEAAAAAMQGVHPLNPGDISQVMNSMIKTRYAESLEGVDPNKKHTVWNWRGGVYTSPREIGVGDGGPEAVIPLNDQGAQFMARSIGLTSTPKGNGFSVYNTRIDRSTNFTGPITVQANDPAELIKKLQARQRVMALSRPSLTGSAA